jgi:hypothetical protein
MIPEVKRERMRRSYHLEKKSLRQEEQQNLNWGKRMTNDPFFDHVLATLYIRSEKAAVRRIGCAFTDCRWMCNEGTI